MVEQNVGCSSVQNNHFRVNPFTQQISRISNDVEKLFRYMIIYFWIHTYGFNTKPGTLSRKLTIFIAILFEVISFNLVIITYLRYGLSDATKWTNISVVSCTILLLFALKCSLFSRSKVLNMISNKLIQMSCLVPAGRAKRLKYQFLFAFFFIDIYIISLVIADAYGLLAEYKKLPHVTRNPILSFEWDLFTLFWILWMHTGQIPAIYFAAVSLTLKAILERLKQMFFLGTIESDHLISKYHELVTIAMKANEAFGFLIFLSSLNSLCNVFNEVYNIIIKPSEFAMTELIYNLLFVVYEYVTFSAMCWTASSVSNAFSNLKCVIDDFPVKVSCERDHWYIRSPTKDFKGFTILDSVVIDKSLIMSATGVLLTYGVMIATLTASTNRS